MATAAPCRNQLVAYPGCSMCLSHPLSLKIVDDLTRKAVEEDWDRNYEEAARLYEESEVYFNHSIEHEIRSVHKKHLLLLKCKQFQDRAKRLHLEKQRKIEDEKRRLEILRFATSGSNKYKRILGERKIL